MLVLLHLVGFAALLGGFLVQPRAVEPEINAAMLYGSWAAFASGSAMVVLVVLGPGLSSYAELVIKLLLTVVIVVLVTKNSEVRPNSPRPRGADRPADAAHGCGRSVVAVLVPVAWQTEGVQVRG